MEIKTVNELRDVMRRNRFSYIRRSLRVIPPSAYVVLPDETHIPVSEKIIEDALLYLTCLAMTKGYVYYILKSIRLKAVK